MACFTEGTQSFHLLVAADALVSASYLPARK